MRGEILGSESEEDFAQRTQNGEKGTELSVAGATVRKGGWLALLTSLLAGCAHSPSIVPAPKPRPVPVSLGNDPWVISQKITRTDQTLFLGGDGQGIKLGMSGQAVARIRGVYSADEKLKGEPTKRTKAEWMDAVSLDFRTGMYSFTGKGRSSKWLFDAKSRSFLNQTKPDPKFAAAEARNRKDSQRRFDIEIEGPVADQQAIRSFLWALRSLGTHPKNPPAPPFGPSSTLYDGHEFWDADVWMLPVLAFADPPRARAIAQYRVQRLSSAQRNARGRGARYPWQSGVTGRELAPKPFTEELHISGDVAWSLKLASSLGLVDSSRAKMITREVANFYRSKLTKTDSVTWGLKGVLGHDEYRKTDNDLVTNLLAQWSINGGTWTRPANAPQLFLPRDRKTFLTYEGDRQLTYKQAAAVLAIFPFQYPPAEREGAAMMERYASRIDPNGPAMTEAIHATIWARLHDPEKAYTTWHEAWQPFTLNQPLLHFSEVRNQIGRTL